MRGFEDLEGVSIAVVGQNMECVLNVGIDRLDLNVPAIACFFDPPLGILSIACPAFERHHQLARWKLQ